MTWRELSVEQFNCWRNPLIIDVRSPCEHESESIPNSVNLPLLSNDERAEVGTIYKQQGEVIARRHALKIVSPKIPSLLDKIIELRCSGQPIVVHCWRGGLRSEAVASFLSIIGIDCFRLTGGYKAWRKQVLADFCSDRFNFMPVVLEGLTGVGKTKLLRTLANLGHCVLDLESLANHRGSIFGGLGLTCQPTQKNFDGQLWQRLKDFGSQSVFLEAEGRRIGRITIPDFLVKKIFQATKILITGSIEVRTKRILDEYANPLQESMTTTAIDRLYGLKERLGTTAIKLLEAQLKEGQVAAAVQGLLVGYYDPLYLRQIERNRPYALEISSDNETEAVTLIISWLNAQRNVVKHFELNPKRTSLPGKAEGKTCCGGLGKEET